MVLKTLVDTILKVQRDPHDVRLAQFLQTLKRDVSRDVVDAFTRSQSLVDRYPNEYRDSPSFLSFLFRLCECPLPSSVPTVSGGEATNETAVALAFQKEEQMQALQKKYDTLLKEHNALKNTLCQLENEKRNQLAQTAAKQRDPLALDFERKLDDLQENLLKKITRLFQNITESKQPESVEPLVPYTNLETSFGNLQAALFKEMSTFKKELVPVTNPFDENWFQRFQDQYLSRVNDVIKNALFPQIETQVKSIFDNVTPSAPLPPPPPPVAALAAPPILPALEFKNLELALSNQIKTLVPIQSLNEMIQKPSEALKITLDNLSTLLTSTSRDVQKNVESFLQNVQTCGTVSTDICQFLTNFQTSFRNQMQSSIESSATLQTSIDRLISENESRQLSIENSVDQLALEAPESSLYMLTKKTPDDVSKSIEQSQSLILNVCQKLSEQVQAIQQAASSKEQFRTLSKHLKDLLETKHAEIFKLLPQIKDVTATAYETIPNLVTDEDVQSILKQFQFEDVFTKLSQDLNEIQNDTGRKEDEATDMDIDENTRSVQGILSHAKGSIYEKAVQVIVNIFGILSHHIPFEFLRQEITRIEESRFLFRTFLKKRYEGEVALESADDWEAYAIHRVLLEEQQLKNVKSTLMDLGTRLHVPEINIDNFNIHILGIVERQRSAIVHLEQLLQKMDTSYTTILRNMETQMNDEIRRDLQYNQYMDQAKRLNEELTYQLEYTHQNTLAITEMTADDVPSPSANEMVLRQKEEEIQKLNTQCHQHEKAREELHIKIQKLENSIAKLEDELIFLKKALIEKTARVDELNKTLTALEIELKQKTNLIRELNETIESLKLSPPPPPPPPPPPMLPLLLKQNIENVQEPCITIPTTEAKEACASVRGSKDYIYKMQTSKSITKLKPQPYATGRKKQGTSSEESTKSETLKPSEDIEIPKEEASTTTKKRLRSQVAADEEDDDEEEAEETCTAAKQKEEISLKKYKSDEINITTITTYFQYLFLKYFILKYQDYIPHIALNERVILDKKLGVIKELTTKSRPNVFMQTLLKYVEFDLEGIIQSNEDFFNKITETMNLHETSTRELLEKCITETSNLIQEEFRQHRDVMVQ